MWIASTLGFFSAVCAREGDGKYHQPVDPDRMMVRVRDSKHLDNLVGFAPELKDCERIKTPHTDYPERIFVPKTVWVDVMARLVEATNYDNFKDAVSKRGVTSYEYKSALSRVWGIFRSLEAPRNNRKVDSSPSSPQETWARRYGTDYKPSAVQTFVPAQYLDEDEEDEMVLTEEDEVLLVQKKRGLWSWETFGVVAYPDVFESNEQAYLEAQTEGGFPAEENVRYLRVYWSRVDGRNLPVYNPYSIDS